MVHMTSWLWDVNQEIWRIKWVSIGQGPSAVGDSDDCTWLADGLKTMSVVVPDKKCKYHGIMLLAC